MFKKVAIAVLGIIFSVSIFLGFSLFSLNYIVLDEDFNNEQIDNLPVREILFTLVENTQELNQDQIEQFEKTVNIDENVETEFKNVLKDFSSNIVQYVKNESDILNLKIDLTEFKKSASDSFTNRFLSGFPDEIDLTSANNKINSNEDLKKGIQVFRIAITTAPVLLVIAALSIVIFMVIVDPRLGVKYSRNKFLSLIFAYSLPALFFYIVPAKTARFLPEDYEFIKPIFGGYLDRAGYIFLLFAIVAAILYVLLVFMHKIMKESHVN